MPPLSRPGPISGPVPRRVRSVMLGPGLPFAGPGPPLLAGRSRLLEYIRESKQQARQHPTRSAGRAGADLRSAENPYREPRTQNGPEVRGVQYKWTLSAWKSTLFTWGSSKPNTQYVDADRTLGSVITQRRRTLPTNSCLEELPAVQTVPSVSSQTPASSRRALPS